MKYRESTVLSPPLAAQASLLGERITRLRQARRMLQSDAALRAGISRPVEPNRSGRCRSHSGTSAPVSRLRALELKEKTQRVRKLSEAELKKLEF